MSSLSQSYVMWMRPSRFTNFGHDSSNERSHQLLAMAAKLQTSYPKPVHPLTAALLFPHTIAILNEL
jgi:hypothetical protein